MAVMSDNQRISIGGSFSLQIRDIIHGFDLRYGIALFKNCPQAFRLLIGLLLVDIAFIAIFVFYGIWFVFNDQPVKYPQIWSLSAEISASEFFGYLNLLGTAGLLYATFKKVRHPLLMSWTVVFVLLLADDALRIHQYGGEWVAGLFPVDKLAGIAVHHIGELVVWLALGTISFIVLLKGMFESTGDERRYNGFFFYVMAGLVICGVGIDLVSSFDYFQNTDEGGALSNILYGFLLIAEDGGELVFMSLGFAGAYAVWRDANRR